MLVTLVTRFRSCSYYSNSGLEDEDPCRRIPKSTVQEQVDERRKKPRHDPGEARGYPKLFRNSSSTVPLGQFSSTTAMGPYAPGTVLKVGETAYDETLKRFDGSWAHVPNYSLRRIRGKLWELGAYHPGSFNSS